MNKAERPVVREIQYTFLTKFLSWLEVFTSGMAAAQYFNDKFYWFEKGQQLGRVISATTVALLMTFSGLKFIIPIDPQVRYY